MGHLRNIFNRIAGSMPVIGPHDDKLITELLLAGRKPLGWISVPAERDVAQMPPEVAAEYLERVDNIKRLDEAVEQGKLKSTDVVVYRQRLPPYTEESGFMELNPPDISRHYCQPENEKDMKHVAAYNQKMFNFEGGAVDLEKSFGEYLGYRKKDEWLWNNMGRLPESLAKIVGKVTHEIGQPAHREKVLLSLKNNKMRPN